MPQSNEAGGPVVEAAPAINEAAETIFIASVDKKAIKMQ
jgi:hypothetical protein